MINISKLYCGQITPGDWLRYGKKGSGELEDRIVPESASQRRPIIVWNVTRACNLKCVHCYNDSGFEKADDELSTDEAKIVLDDLSGYGVPSVLFSGGEPLMRPDLFELIGYAVEKGLRTVISTNGTLITANVAKQMKQHGVSYVGISLDGIGKVNDKFRGVAGAFDKAVEGIKNCQDAGVRIGLRLTLTKRNVQDLERLFDFFEAENIERACFYHFVPSGRGENIANENLTHAQTRDAVETILSKTREYKQAGRTTDILTVDNHVDGVYIYLKLRKEDPAQADEVYKLLAWNGGGMYSSGVGIGCIDFHGKVHPDQFWWHYDLGDVRERPFSEVWTDTSDPLLRGLKNRRKYIKGRCRLCQFFDICGGSLRVRADLHFGDPWAPEPSCYLTDGEIGLDKEKQEELKRSGEIFQMPELMDKTDSRILQELQDNFPLCERPYEVIAERLQIPTEELWSRIQQLLDDSVIRRMGASFDSNKLGFHSTLAAVRIKPEQIERASEIIGRFPEVTHSYLRKDEFNIWFTIIAADKKKIADILEHIRTTLSLNKSDVLNLPVRQLFKLDARFHNYIAAP